MDAIIRNIDDARSVATIGSAMASVTSAKANAVISFRVVGELVEAYDALNKIDCHIVAIFDYVRDDVRNTLKLVDDLSHQLQFDNGDFGRCEEIANRLKDLLVVIGEGS